MKNIAGGPPPAPVVYSGTARDQAQRDQPVNHHRNRALMGVGALGQLVDRADRTNRELLEHEKLGAADPEFTLGPAGGKPEHSDNPPDGVECVGKGSVDPRTTPR